MKKIISMGVSLIFVCSLVHAEEFVFVWGDLKLVLNNQGKLQCSNCGYGDKRMPINGPVPQFTGAGSGPQAYFNGRNLLIVREDQGVSCPAGGWYAIDITARTSKEIKFPNCDEPDDVSYSTVKNKVAMKVIQGKKITTFGF